MRDNKRVQRPIPIIRTRKKKLGRVLGELRDAINDPRLVEDPVPYRPTLFPFTPGLRFGLKKIDLKDVTVRTGTLRLEGIDTYDVAEKTISLSGSTEWIYIAHAKNHSSTVFAHLATEPKTSPSHYNLCLYKLIARNGTYYVPADDGICHVMDFFFTTPLK